MERLATLPLRGHCRVVNWSNSSSAVTQGTGRPRERGGEWLAGYHIVLIHSSIARHLSFFHILAIMLLWTLGCMHLRITVWVFTFSNKYSSEKFLGCMVVLFSVFWESSTLFSTVDAPIYRTINNVQGSHFLQYLANICYLCSLWWWQFWQVW